MKDYDEVELNVDDSKEKVDKAIDNLIQKHTKHTKEPIAGLNISAVGGEDEWYLKRDYPYKALTMALERYSDSKDERERDISTLHTLILKEVAKFFDVDDAIHSFFMGTKAPKNFQPDRVMMPFPSIFINRVLVFDDWGIKKNKRDSFMGVLITEHSRMKDIMLKQIEENKDEWERFVKDEDATPEEMVDKVVEGIEKAFWAKRQIEITTFYSAYEEGEESNNLSVTLNLDTGSIVYDGKDLNDLSETNARKISKPILYLVDYVKNLLLFLNEPRVIVKSRSVNNKRRVKKGLTPIPSLLVTRITEELKKYIYEGYKRSEARKKLGYAYDVRGHWRTLRSPRYGEKQGTQIWVKDHTRGDGLKPPQKFQVKGGK
jgi:hypothetical protein